MAAKGRRRRLRPELSTFQPIALVVVLSSVFASPVLYWIYGYAEQWRAEAREAEIERIARIVRIPVPARKLFPGEGIAEGDLVLAPYPGDLVAADAITEIGSLVGRVVLEPCLPGEPIRDERLAEPGTSAGLGALVPRGTRAITLNLRDDDRVSGFVEPGDTVDVLATLPEDAGREAETLTLVEAVRVLAVDERISETARGEIVRKPQVTLAVTPEDAVRITAVPSNVTRLKLVLRSEVDFERPAPEGVTVADLLGGSSARRTVGEYREQVTPAVFDHWIDLIEGTNVVRERVIDPAHLRDPVSGQVASASRRRRP